MDKTVASAWCPRCLSPRVAPVAGKSGLPKFFMKILSGRISGPEEAGAAEGIPGWHCLDCGQSWGNTVPAQGAGAGERAEPAAGMRLMTVSFADLAFSAGFGERLTAEDLVAVLNRHFSLQAAAVLEQQGRLDGIYTTAIRAFWGLPFAGKEDHARLACRAALAQLQAIDRLQGDLVHLPPVWLYIGISTGRVVSGKLGPEGARSHRVLGDTVDLGQRLAAVNQYYGTSILVTEETIKLAGAAVVAREIDFLLVKGRKDPVRIFELLGRRGEVPEPRLRLCGQFEAALAAYRREEWDLGERTFQACLEISPGDTPSMLFLERIKHLRAKAPDEQWNGVGTTG
jgi:adenylate cyclase